MVGNLKKNIRDVADKAEGRNVGSNEKKRGIIFYQGVLIGE